MVDRASEPCNSPILMKDRSYKSGPPALDGALTVGSSDGRLVVERASLITIVMLRGGAGPVQRECCPSHQKCGVD